MKTVTLILEVVDADWAIMEPVLMDAIDSDETIGMRVKDLGRPEHELAVQVYANVLSLGVE